MTKPPPRVLLDTCVMYPTVMREVLLGVARAGLFTPLWSARILEEWARAARKIGPTGEAQARAEVALVSAHWPDAAVKDFAHLEARLYLPDANDLHVLAAAIRGNARLLITVNAKDFPREELRTWEIERCDPDRFLVDLWTTAPDVVSGVVEAVRREAEVLSGAPWEARALMKKARLPRLGKAVAAHG